jgi:hypothetical protein
MSALTVAVEIQGYDQAAGAPGAWYYASRGFQTGGSDTPAHRAFTPRLQSPGWLRREAAGRDLFGGRTEAKWGEITFTNVDGGLDALAAVAWAGWPVTVRLGVVGTPYPAAWTTVLSGTLDQGELTEDLMVLRVADPTARLLNPLQGSLYGGTNALPNGVDGVPGDIKGRPIPLLFGVAKTVAPPCVNTARLIYQVSEGALASVEGVYDRGSALTAGSPYASLAEMEATPPAAGTYRPWLAGGLVRIAFLAGGAGDGRVTVDATEGATPAARTVGQILQRIALKAGISAGAISAADVAALDAVAPAEVGIHVADATSAAEAMDRTAQSVGAWWGFDETGTLRMGRIAAPGTPVVSLTQHRIKALTRLVSEVPPWRIKLNYARNHVTQTDLAGGVSADRKAALGQEYRTTTAEDGAIKGIWLTASEAEHNTLLASAADAEAEAARRLALVGTYRERYRCEAEVSQALMSALALGATVRIEYPRYGRGAGKHFVILGLAPY